MWQLGLCYGLMSRLETDPPLALLVLHWATLGTKGCCNYYFRSLAWMIPESLLWERQEWLLLHCILPNISKLSCSAKLDFKREYGLLWLWSTALLLTYLMFLSFFQIVIFIWRDWMSSRHPSRMAAQHNFPNHEHSLLCPHVSQLAPYLTSIAMTPGTRCF